jgi:uncharacterized LabA/DUF88 family protein
MSLSFREQLSSAVETLPKYRVAVYIDGFNFYFGIRWEAIKRGSARIPDPRWYRYMWVDPHKMSMEMLTNRQELMPIKYFTARILGGKQKQQRQNAYLDAISILPKLQMFYGRFEPDRKECDKCGHSNLHPQEKKTDVNIATNFICDALSDAFDTAILVTGDSDLIPAIEAVKQLKPQNRVVVAFPPNRYSRELEEACHAKIHIWEPLLRKCRLPEIIKREGLPDLVRPRKYSGESGCTSDTNVKTI